MTVIQAKWTIEKILLWSVLVLGGMFVLAMLLPLLLLGLGFGFAFGVFACWRNPWGIFRFMEPELEDTSKPLATGQATTQGGKSVTINLQGDQAPPIVRVPCAHCGSMVDIVQNATCPKCGAPMK